MASAVSDLRSAGRGNERFNAEALSWDTRPFVQSASSAAAQAILARCETLNFQPKDVIEIGCGTGILSFLIAPHVNRVVAIDAAEGMIDVLRTKLGKPGAPGNVVPVCVLLEDPEDAALPSGDQKEASGPRLKFDLVTSHLVLHHIPDLGAVLKTMHGCLRPGGRAMLTDFEDFGPQARRFHPEGRLDGVERHGINVKEMTGLMEKAGFRNVKVSPEWTMVKDVEKYAGAFGEKKDGFDYEDKAEKMQFPFVVCYGEKE